MGHKLDLSGLTELEAEHVLQVLQRDMRLRKKEEQRLIDLRQELEEEDGRCLLLSRQTRFNRLCCIRCCSPFNFLLNPRRRCGDCLLNVCRACRAYRKPDGAWLCSTCQKRRLLKARSLEWFYVNVKCRFKRFGSAKVLKTLYRKHLAERGALSELTEGSAYEDSIYNEDSICESDTVLCHQSEEHGMADTLTVAKRVAGDAIDEAISKAEFHTDNQAKQNEAHYLREHRGELIEELAKTIVQKIILRRKALAEMKPEFDQEWPPDSIQGSLTHQAKIWRSQSAFSLLDNTSSELTSPLGLKKEGGGSAMSTWKSVDRLDNSMLQSPDGNWMALQSAQLSRPSLLTKRKSLAYSALERESGLVSAYEAMDSEPETPPEYSGSRGAVLQDLHKKMAGGGLDIQGLEGDPHAPPRPIGRRPGVDGVLSDRKGVPEHRRPSLAFMKRQLPQEIRRPSSSRRTSIMNLNFNPEGSMGGRSSGGEELMDSGRVRRSRRKSKKEKGPSLSLLPKCNKNHQDATPDKLTSEAATPDPVDLEGGVRRQEVSIMGEELVYKLQQLARQGSLLDASVGDDDEGLDRGKEEEKERKKNGERGGEQLEEYGRRSHEGDEDMTRSENTFQEDGIDRLYHKTEEEEDQQEEEEEAVKEMKMEYNLCRLTTQSRVVYSSSAHLELNGACQSEGGWEIGGAEREEEEKDVTGRNGQTEEEEDLVFQLLHLESQVRANQFSSTEDELDRVGRGDNDRERESGVRGVELAAKLCQLAEQVSAGEFSSTDDERESVGRAEAEVRWREGGGGPMGKLEEETLLWRMEAEKAIQASQLRDLVGLVSASQFSSTEDELDQVGGGGGGRGGGWEAVKGRDTEAGREPEEAWVGTMVRGGVSMESTAERRGSMAELDVGMFDLLDSQEADECRRHGEERTPEGTVHQDTTEEEGEHGYPSLGGGCGVEDRDWPQEGQTEDLSCASVEREEENRERWLQTGQGEDTERQTNNSGEKQVLLAGTWQQAETKSDTSEHEDVELDRIMSTTREERDRDLDNVDGETEVLSKEAVGEPSGHASQERDHSETVERQGDQSTTLGSICSREGDGSERVGKEMETGGERIAGGWEEQGAIASGSQAGEFRLEVIDDTPRGNGDINPEDQTSILSPEEIQNRYSAVSLRSLTTEMLKVLNATEALLHGVGGVEDPAPTRLLLSVNTDPLKLDQQFSRLEENVYVAAGTVFSLESELGGLEECARGVSGDTPDGELTFLEEQVASAAAKVHQSELQISNISDRIAALKSAGLNVDSQSRTAKARMIPTTVQNQDS